MRVNGRHSRVTAKARKVPSESEITGGAPGTKDRIEVCGMWWSAREFNDGVSRASIMKSFDEAQPQGSTSWLCAGRPSMVARELSKKQH